MSMEGEQTQNQVSNEEIMSLDDGSGSSDAYVSGSICGGGAGESSIMERQPPPMISKLYHMVENLETNHIISWSSTGTSFIVWQPHLFAAEIMPNYFRHNNFSSFVSQLSTYGFSKINWDKWEYQNDYFQKGNKNLLNNIKRKPYASQVKQQKKQHTTSSPDEATRGISMVGIGNLDQEIKSLRDEHTLLNKEMMTLKKQIEESERELEMVKKESDSCKRKQEKLAMFVKQEVLTKEETGEVVKRNYSGFINVNDYMKLEKMLAMDDGVVNSSESIGEGHTETTQHANNAIDMEDLIEGSSDWAHYVKALGG